ncbi:MAG TPA: hypothetical protein VGJ84_14035 [Polyangiaceae bacterium]
MLTRTCAISHRPRTGRSVLELAWLFLPFLTGACVDSSKAGGNAGGAGGSANDTGGSPNDAGGSPSGDGSGTATPAGLHVAGRNLVDGNGETVVLRGVEHVARWNPNAPADATGSQVPEIARTGTNAIRILGSLPGELDSMLHQAIIENHMWVSVANVDWADPITVSTISKYADYVTLHAQGEVNYRGQGDRWQSDSINVIGRMRQLGYTSPLELLSTGYGQELDTVLNHGDAVFDADPLRNVVFGVQMYSNVGNNVSSWLDQAKAFDHPILVGSCLFQEGIDNAWGNTATTYQQVWDGSYARLLNSFYWMWHGDNNQMSNSGSFGALTTVGQYLVNDSPAALSSTPVKSAFILNSRVN